MTLEKDQRAKVKMNKENKVQSKLKLKVEESKEKNAGIIVGIEMTNHNTAFIFLLILLRKLQFKL